MARPMTPAQNLRNLDEQTDPAKSPLAGVSIRPLGEAPTKEQVRRSIPTGYRPGVDDADPPRAPIPTDLSKLPSANPDSGAASPPEDQARPEAVRPQMEVPGKGAAFQVSRPDDSRPSEESPKQTDPNYLPVELPSQYVLYDFTSMNARKFLAKDVFKISKATKAVNVSVMTDALAATIDQDIRKLSIPDWRALMMWQRLNSYPAMPITVQWTTDTGRVVTTTVLTHQIKVKKLDMTREQWMEWKAKGFSYPSVEDMIWWQNQRADEDEQSAFEWAQYFALPDNYDQLSARDKHAAQRNRIRRILNGEVSMEQLMERKKLEDILEDYGIDTRVEVLDEKYDPLVHLKTLKDLIERLEDSEHPAAIVRHAQAMAEHDELERRLDNGEKVTAEPKEVRIDFNVLTFFPTL